MTVSIETSRSEWPGERPLWRSVLRAAGVAHGLVEATSRKCAIAKARELATALGFEVQP